MRKYIFQGTSNSIFLSLSDPSLAGTLRILRRNIVRDEMPAHRDFDSLENRIISKTHPSNYLKKVED